MSNDSLPFTPALYIKATPETDCSKRRLEFFKELLSGRKDKQERRLQVVKQYVTKNP